MRDTMPNASETIEKLAKQLERLKFLNDLRDCETLEDFKQLTKKYEVLCEEDSKKELVNRIQTWRCKVYLII